MDIKKFFSFGKKEPEPVSQYNPHQISESRKSFLNTVVSANIAYANWGNRGVEQFLGGNVYSMPYSSYFNYGYRYLQYTARKTFYDSSEAKAIIRRLVDNIINRGLSLEATPVYQLIDPKGDITDDERKTWTRTLEAMWKLWSKSNTADVRGLINFNQLQYLATLNLLKDGEFFVMLKYSSSRDLINPLQFQIIDCTQVQSPVDKLNFNDGRQIIDGIEVDKNGQEVAFYVYDYRTYEFKRIPKFGPKSKRLFMIHGFKHEYAGQVRGLPILTSVIQELEKLTDYTLAEIQAAVINATLAVWVKPSDDRPSSRPLAGVSTRDTTRKDLVDEVLKNSPNDGVFTKPGVVIQNLKPGEEIQSFDTKRPNVNFDQFVTSVKKSLAASLSIPPEVLDQLFGSNFSASRASLVMFWNVVNQWRFEIESTLLNPVYQMWLQNEVELKRVEATGFMNSALMREAWLNARWVGISKPSIDPFKEARAVNQRLNDGLSTREYESQQYNGLSFNENIDILKNENQELAEATVSPVEESASIGEPTNE